MRLGLGAAYAVLLAALAFPVLLVNVPVGIDTLAHLARLHARAHIETDPDIARLFAVRQGLIPYMAMDWLLTPLVSVMSALQVGRIVTVLCVWCVVGSVAVLSRAFQGYWGTAPLLAGVIAWNGITAWGFLNYLLGLSMALGTLALWHVLRDRPGWQRVLVFGVAAAGLYVMHLLALVLYAGLIGLYAVFFGAWHPRHWPVMAAQFAPPVLLWLAYAPPIPQGKLGVMYNLPAAVISFASPTLFPSAEGGWESGHLVLLATVLGLAGLTRAGLVTWHRPLLAMAGVLCLLGLALPVVAVGISWLNLRLPLASACVAISAIRFHGSRHWGWAVAGLVLVRVASVAATMKACAPDYAELRQAMQVLPRGVALTPVLERQAPAHSCSWLPIYEHAANLVTLERAGLSSDYFAQTTSVTGRGGVPTDRKAIEMADASRMDLGKYVLWMHRGRLWPLPAGAVVLARASFFDVLRIDGR